MYVKKKFIMERLRRIQPMEEPSRTFRANRASNTELSYSCKQYLGPLLILCELSERIQTLAPTVEVCVAHPYQGIPHPLFSVFRG